MKLGLMQPYFFPYLGYFNLINQVDEWVVFDNAQYMKQHWVNRNRILHPVTGWWYITAPVKKHPHQAQINEIEIATDIDWRGKILRQLQHYKNKAPYYQSIMLFLEECFADLSPNLSEANIRTLQKTCQMLGINTRFYVLSQTKIALENTIEHPGEWALRVSSAFGASEYINASGGAMLFDRNKFAAHNIQLTIQSFTNMVYACEPYQFEPALSIIDVMMWNSREEIKHYLDKSASAKEGE